VGSLLVSLGAALAVAAGGCSSTALPDDGGGTGGAGGHSGTDCHALIADYDAALAEARVCNPFLDNLQCTQVVAGGLQCNGCPTHVSDATRLDAIRAQFEANRVDCPPPACAPIHCPASGEGQCVADDGGPTGHCVNVYR
jgi:hypothetical protein